MKIKCPYYVDKALELLNSKGFKAYIVGGCVRDTLMGREPDDWDMTTSALPRETITAFKDYRTIPTGIKHGTVTVLIDGHPLEITTMRIDGTYSDNRRPDNVEFTEDIEVDLSRRDFTSNAIAYNHTDGIIDPFGGTSDIKNRIIRCVGNPDRRFNEDALRIIRALRFSCVLDFDIEDSTKQSIIKNMNLLNEVAVERIRVELLKLLNGLRVEKILDEYKEVFFEIIPELRSEDGFEQHTKYHSYDVWTHTVKTVGGMKNDALFRMAALLHDVAKPDCFRLDENGTGHFKGHAHLGAEKATEILHRMRFSNSEIRLIYNIIYLHDDRPNGDIKALAHLCSRHGIENVRNSLEMIKADLYGKNPEYFDDGMAEYVLGTQQLDEIEKSQIPLCVKELNINGNDLRNIGITGSIVRSVFEELLNRVIDSRVENEKEALLICAKKIADEQA